MLDQTPSSSSFDSAELYEACGSDDPAVQAEAYRALWPYLYRVAYQVVYRQPEAADLAQDCAQVALIRVHEQRQRCREPKAFRSWARRIVSNVAIDELRRRQRLLPLAAADDPEDQSPGAPPPGGTLAPERVTLQKVTLANLRRLLNLAPISERSRRVVIGRYLDELPDEILAQTESELADRAVRPSHIQVTRSKNMAKLQRWELLQTFLDEAV